MLVLHAAVLEGGLWLWGESAPPAPAAPEPPKRASTAKRTHKKKVVARKRPAVPKTDPAEPQPLIYDAGNEELSAALREASVGFTPAERQFERLVAWLPSLAGRPVPSSSLIDEPPLTRAKPKVLPWLVSAVGLTPQQALELLCACVNTPTLLPGVIISRDLAFWTTAMRFAGSLVARQQLLPDIQQENGSFRACWKPVIAGPDAPALTRLSKSLPPAARALTRLGQPEPQVPAARLVPAFVNRIVDQLVRSATFLRPPAGPDRHLQQVAEWRRAAASGHFESAHDRWLHALCTADGLMKGGPHEMARLARQVREWQRPVEISARAPLRLCFRLDEPQAEPPVNGHPRAERRPWRVHYLLQASDDPSLLLPAAEAWRTSGPSAELLRRNGFNAREYMLMALGQASGICPRIEASLKSSAPSGYNLDAPGAYEFLTEKAAALEQAGFGVLLPAWWTRKGTKVKLAVRANLESPPLQGNGGLSLDRVVAFDWELAIGDHPLTLAELEALAELKSPLVQFRGHWVQLKPEELREALRFAHDKATRSASLGELIQMALGGGESVGSIAFGGVTARGWVADLLAKLEGREPYEELPHPQSFKGTLRPYQVRGYSWLSFLRKWGLGACLADDMGLGKTIQTLAMIQREWDAGDRRPVLLICPTSVVGNWQKEAARFTPELPVMVHHGVTRARGPQFTEEAAHQAVVISSYALLHRDLEFLAGVPWAGIILDEAQNIKNPQTKQARAARALKSDYRTALTGTPVENNVGDLWSIMEFLNPRFLGSQAEFKRRFFIPIQAGRDPEAARLLKRITGPFILRRLKTDRDIIADLPDKLEMKVFCNLTKEQASLYAAVVKDAEKAIDASTGIRRKGLILATLVKLKQICNHPAQFLGDGSEIGGRSGKLARLTEMLEEIISVGDRALVFSQFAEMGSILQRHLQGCFGREVLFLHGAVPKKQREHMIEQFQDPAGPPVFLLSLKAGGTGLNLTEANHVFHFDRWWNPAVENQATDRAFRIGQSRNVQVHKFLCVGTLEERIDEMIERKKGVAERVVGTGEGWLTELSGTELKKLFQLRRDAVGD